MTLAEELRSIPLFADLPAEGLEWLASRMEVRDFAAGETFFEAGAPADRMFVLLEGEIRSVPTPGNAAAPVFALRAGRVSGMLPYSRMTQIPATSRAVVPSRAAFLRTEFFAEMLERLPELPARLVGVLTDRVRESTKAQDQHEKLVALGKISAGLAHELNNPAAAARRAAGSLREAVHDYRAAAAQLDAHTLTCAQRAAVPQLEQELSERAVGGGLMDSLERSDCQERIAACLDRHGVPRAWEVAPALVEAGCDAGWFERVAAQFPAEAFPALLGRLSASLAIAGLVGEIENSSARISDLVRAVKEYTYADQGGEQEIDIHQGLESTLLIFRHRLKHGVEVKLDFDRSLPRICARGSQLNQVWTNLIDNAIDAMQGKGELRIHTARELDRVLVEIGDNGPGIPPEIRDHIFEPFFTTKGVGQGTGLGLETVGRIVYDHHGDIQVESQPGDTRFQIRLPIPNHTGATA